MTKTDQQNVPKLRFPEFDGAWEERTLGEIAKIYDGTHQTPKYVKEGVPFFSVEHVTANQFKNTKFISREVFEAENKRVKLERDDILMTRIGDIGTARLIDWDVEASFYVSLALLKQDSAKFISKFLSTYIHSPYVARELYRRTIHVAFPKKINLGEISHCKLHLPTLPEQRKIASFLGSVDTKIAQLSQKKALLEDYKKGCMQQLFSQKIRFKDDNGKDFPDWEEKRLGNLCKIGSSKRVLQKDWQEHGVPFLRTREIISLANGINFRTPIFISNELFKELKSKYGIPREGDILTTGVGSIGEIYIVKPEDRFYFKDGNVLWIKKSTDLNSHFLAHQFKHHFVQKQIMDNASITTVATFTIDDAKKLKIKYPHPDEQRKIADFLSAIDRKIELVGHELSHARTFKQGLLQQMFV